MTAKIMRDDNLAPRDLVAKLTGARREKHDDQSRKLHGLVVTSRALSLSGLTRQAFGEKYADRLVGGQPVRKSYLQDKWFAGEVRLSRSKAKLIDQDVGGTLELYDHSVFPLLQDAPLSLSFIAHCLETYTKDTIPLSREWRFPDDDIRMSDKTFLGTPCRNDSTMLVHRHDLHGFTCVLGLVREAEARGDSSAHAFHLRSLYRCLPAVLEVPWFKEHSDLLCSCIEAIQTRMTYSAFILKVEWDWIHALSMPPLHKEFQTPTESMKWWRKFETDELDVVEEGEICFLKPPLKERFDRAIRATRRRKRWREMRSKVFRRKDKSTARNASSKKDH